MVVATSVCSAVFNFLIKFGLSRDTPVAVSIATQIGIPLNLMVDFLIVNARIDAYQALGTMLMLLAFSLQKSSGTSHNSLTNASGSAAPTDLREPMRKQAEHMERSAGDNE